MNTGASERYVHVTDGHDIDPRPGLGYMLRALSEAFVYARVTDRSLIVDWRDTVYLRDGTTNLFTELFDPAPSVLGVEVIGDDIDDRVRGKCRFTLTEEYYIANLARWDENRARYWALRWQSAARESGIPEPPVPREPALLPLRWFPLRFRPEEVIYAPYVGAAIATWVPSICDYFVSTLVPRDVHRRKIYTFAEEHFADRTVVGCHIRHGNGERGHFQLAGRAIKDVKRWVQQAANATWWLEDQLGKKVVLFLCTDSDVVVDAMREVRADVLVREQWRPPRNAGGLIHLGAQCPDGEIANAANALIDMYLLSMADYELLPLGGYKQPSWFRFMATSLARYQQPFYYFPLRTGRLRSLLEGLRPRLSKPVKPVERENAQPK